MTHSPAEALREAILSARANPEDLYDHTYFPLVTRELLDRVAAALASPAPAGGEDKLKPCPFCGEQPTSKWHGASGEDDDSGYWGIDCCQAFSHDADEASAVARWNERAEPVQELPPPSPDVAGVKLADRVDLTGGARPAHVLESLTESVNQAWAIIGDNARCSVPATFIGWLLQEYESISAEKGRLAQRVNDLEDLRYGVASMVLADVNGGKENCLHNGSKWDAATYVSRARALTPKEKA